MDKSVEEELSNPFDRVEKAKRDGNNEALLALYQALEIFGKIYSSMGENDKAMNNYLKALEICEQVASEDKDKLEDVARCYLSIAILNMTTDKDDEAKRAASTALAIYEQIQAIGKMNCLDSIEICLDVINISDNMPG